MTCAWEDYRMGADRRCRIADLDVNGLWLQRGVHNPRDTVSPREKRTIGLGDLGQPCAHGKSLLTAYETTTNVGESPMHQSFAWDTQGLYPANT